MSGSQRRIYKQQQSIASNLSLYEEQDLSSYTRYLWNQGSLCVLIGATVFTFGNLLAKIASKSIPPFQITFTRCFLSLLATEGIIYGFNIPKKFGTKKKIPILFAQGIAGAISTSGFYYAIQQLSLGEAVTINFLNPVFVVPLSFIFFKDYVGWRSILGILAAMFGVVFIQKPSFIFTSEAQIWNQNRVVGIMSAFIGAFAVALMFILVRSAGRHENCIVITQYFYFLGTIMSFLALIFGLPDYFVAITFEQGLLLFAQAALSFVAQVFTNHGFQVGRSGVVASVNYVQVFYSYFLDIVIFHIVPDFYGILGSCLIAIGVVFVNTEKDRRREQKVQLARQSINEVLTQGQQANGYAQSENDLEQPILDNDRYCANEQNTALQIQIDKIQFTTTPAEAYSYH